MSRCQNLASGPELNYGVREGLRTLHDVAGEMLSVPADYCAKQVRGGSTAMTTTRRASQH